MNPSMVTSKRLLFSSEDMRWIASGLEPEYLVEFRVAPGASPGAVLAEYEAAGFPTASPNRRAGSGRVGYGFESLRPKYAGGHPPKLDTTQRRLVKQIVLARPGEHGCHPSPGRAGARCLV